MSRYRRYGELDSVIHGEMDKGFLGFNNRLRPDQLKSGILAASSNGRCDLNGEWQTRKGIQLKVAPLSQSVLTLPFVLYDSIPSVSTYSRSGTTLTIDFSAAHGITAQQVTDGVAIVNLSGLSVTGGENPNGNRLVTAYTDTDTIDIEIAGMTATPTGTLTVTGAKLDDDAVDAVYGATSFYDDSSSLEPYIIIAQNASATAVKLSDNSTTTISYPGSTVISSEVDMKEYYGKVFIFREGLTALVWDGDLSGSPAFAEVSSGAYTQPAELAATGFTITDGLATATVSNTLSEGDRVVLTDAGGSTLPEDSIYTVASASGSNFTFYVDSDDVSNQTDTVWTKKVSEGLGFIHMPNPPFAVNHQGRLAMPFWYDNSGDRGTRDEIIFSNIQDHNTYDQIYGQFVVRGDKSDYNVGLHSFSEDKLVVLNRESIHVITGSADLATAQTTLLTNEVGCVARKTILQVGNKMMFLSDNGVYALDFMDLYNLRGNEIPLSESIDATIQRINREYIHNCEAVYHDNRYYLSCPLDGSMTNNAVLVYNFLNREWESIDTVDDEAWAFPNLTLAGSGDTRGVYVVNTTGGVHKLYSKNEDTDTFVSAVGGSTKNLPIQGSMTTRMFTFSDLNRKKWNSYDIHIQSSDYNVSDANLSLILENFDEEYDLGTISEIYGSTLGIGEDTSLRGRTGNPRAYGLQFKIDTISGRPKVRAIHVNGIATMGSSLNAT